MSKRWMPLEPLENRTLLSFQTFTPPTASSAIQSETVGKDGSLYFVEADQQQIGRITPKGKIIEYTVPDSFGDIGSLVTASDGSIWFNTSNADSPLLGHITTRGKVASVAINNDAIGIGISTDGGIWFSTVEDGIGRVGTRNAVTYFGGTEAGGVITKIIAGPDGSVFFSEVSKSNGQVGTPYAFTVHQGSVARGQLRNTVLYTSDTSFNFDNGAAVDAVAEAGNLAISGGELWFFVGHASDGYDFKGIDPTTGALLGEWSLYINYPDIRNVNSLTNGPDGHLWFVDHTAGGKQYEIPGVLIDGSELPSGSAATPFAIVAGGFNTFWITDETNGVIYKWTEFTGLDNPMANAVFIYNNGDPYYGLLGVRIDLLFYASGQYDRYQIERSTSPTGKYAVVGKVSGSNGGLAFSDTHAATNTVYYYRVRSTSSKQVIAGPTRVDTFRKSIGP